MASLTNVFISCTIFSATIFFFPVGSDPVFYTPLYPVTYLYKSSRNKTSVALGRLQSDGYRLGSIGDRIERVIYVDEYDPDPSVPLLDQFPLSRLYAGGGSYAAQVKVGAPERVYHLIVDINTDSILRFPCRECRYCHENSGPSTSQPNSSTFAPLSCFSKECTNMPYWLYQCYEERCGYRSDLGGDLPELYGILTRETITLHHSAYDDVIVGCEIGVGNHAGSIGLGGGWNSLRSQINLKSFSYCLVDMDSRSSSTLEFNSQIQNNSIIIPMTYNPKMDIGIFFNVGLTGITVDGVVLPIPPSLFQIQKDGTRGTIIDSGSSVTFLPVQAYDALKGSLLNYTTPRRDPFGILDTCYQLRDPKPFKSFPPIGFNFGHEAQILVEPKNYLRAVDSVGTYCLYFAPSSVVDFGRPSVMDTLTIMGTAVQQGTRVAYDLANKQIGFSKTSCVGN